MRRGSLLIALRAEYSAAGPDGFSFSRERADGFHYEQGPAAYHVCWARSDPETMAS